MISEEDFEKLINSDLKKIKPYLEKNKFKDKNGIIKAQVKNFYYAINNYFLIPYGGNFYHETLFLYGAIFRCHELYLGFFDAWSKRNIHLNAYCLRAIAETLALVYYCNINEGYLKAALLGSRDSEDDEMRIRNIVTMIEKLDKKHKGIKLDYDGLCDYVHPNPTSLFAPFYSKGEDDKAHHISIRFGCSSEKFDDKMVNTSIMLLLHWVNWFFEEIKILFEKQHEKFNQSPPK